MKQYILPALWLVFAAYWMSRSRGNKSSVRRESSLERTVYVTGIVIAVCLMSFPSSYFGGLGHNFINTGGLSFEAGVLLTAAGLMFAVWARRHLGSNWSGAISVKKDHELIRTGPYAYVRHPIYTGVLTAFFGSALSLGEWRGLAAVFLMLAALQIKIRREEQLMKDEFAEEYEVYKKEVKAIIPFVL